MSLKPCADARGCAAGSHRLFGDGDLDDVIGVDDRAIGGRIALLDRVQHVPAIHKLPDNGILPVKEGRGARIDEELAVGAVGVPVNAPCRRCRPGSSRR